MELAEYCRNLAAACGEAGTWVTRNTEVVRNEQEGLLKELRRAGRIFRRCARAAGRKMCAGVFGPSQAGKSYLISALARDSQGNLMACFGDAREDFIKKINPEGGKESTGLVTRFTMTRPANLPAGHPVQVRLLSETDLVKIVANTYYADCEHKEEQESDIAKTLERLSGRAGGVSHIDLDALEDLREYLLRDFRSKARVQDLEREFWDQAQELGPTLSLDDRVDLYALIWDEVPEFTELLRTLLRALESLGHAEEAFCPLDALIPREQSIIDVATLAGLGGSSTQDAPPLELVTPAGKKAVLPRAVVTALTAELAIVMDQQPAPYFEHTDLLDFPGYRSRYKFDDVRRELKKDGMLKEMFLRGKVAYLFQRYCAERELTSMLLCIGPSNQEVQDLPGVIDDWVCGTHGARPEDRANKQASLFFILTKFDMEFERKQGAPEVRTRWDNRLHASLLDFFGKGHDWPREWSPGRAFNNLFLLRNPNFRFDAILEYGSSDQNAREKGIRADQQAYVGELEKAFMDSALVARHFREPRRSWDAAMLLNDGGITLIRESLSPLCKPELKAAQLRQGVNDAKIAVYRRLKDFYRSDDREALRQQKLKLVKTLFARLGKLEQTHQRLGRLLHSLTVTDAEIFDKYPDAHRAFLKLPEEVEQAAAEVEIPEEDVEIGEVDLDAWNPFAETAKSATAEPAGKAEKAPAAPKRDEAAVFAEHIESYWVERLRKLADDADLQKYFMLPGQDFSALVGELALGMARLGLRDEMAAAFRRAAAYANTGRDSIVRRQAGIAAHAINSYVDWLGFNPRVKDEAGRTVRAGAGGSVLVLFQPLPRVEGFPVLGETRDDYTAQWFRDWLNAFYALVMDNVNFDGEQTINVEENALLGGILKKFRDEA